jgi:hypothetical protein
VERVKEGEYGSTLYTCTFAYMYENRTMKPAEIVLRSWEKGDEGE